MNAQLWAEVIRSFSQVEWQIYPKIYGLVERSWNNRSALTLSEYNHLVYDVFIPQLAASSRNFHIQQPGIRSVGMVSMPLEGYVETDTVVPHLITMNKVMQGGEILYRIDEGEWQTYNEPFVAPEQTNIIRAKIRYLGKESNTTWCWMN
jgi:hypothetical protein